MILEIASMAFHFFLKYFFTSFSLLVFQFFFIFYFPSLFLLSLLFVSFCLPFFLVTLLPHSFILALSLYFSLPLSDTSGRYLSGKRMRQRRVKIARDGPLAFQTKQSYEHYTLVLKGSTICSKLKNIFMLWNATSFEFSLAEYLADRLSKQISFG